MWVAGEKGKQDPQDWKLKLRLEIEMNRIEFFVLDLGIWGLFVFRSNLDVDGGKRGEEGGMEPSSARSARSARSSSSSFYLWYGTNCKVDQVDKLREVRWANWANWVKWW